ncbi:hypothetical protein ACFX13_012301 [Malus domestica]
MVLDIESDISWVQCTPGADCYQQADPIFENMDANSAHVLELHISEIEQGLIPKDLVDRLSSLRNQIVLVAEDTGGSTISKLRRALEEYLSVLIGLTKKEYGLERLVEFKWKCLEDGKQVNGP